MAAELVRNGKGLASLAEPMPDMEDGSVRAIPVKPQAPRCSWPSETDVGSRTVALGPTQCMELDDEGYYEMHRAAAAGNLQLVRQILADGLDIEARTGKTPDAYTANIKQNVQHVLWRMMIPVSGLSGGRLVLGVTPLDLAAFYGHEKVVTQFLLSGAKMERLPVYNLYKDKTGYASALYLAMQQGHVAVVERLLDFDEGAEFLNFNDFLEGQAGAWRATTVISALIRDFPTWYRHDSAKRREFFSPCMVLEPPCLNMILKKAFFHRKLQEDRELADSVSKLVLGAAIARLINTYQAIETEPKSIALRRIPRLMYVLAKHGLLDNIYVQSLFDGILGLQAMTTGSVTHLQERWALPVRLDVCDLKVIVAFFAMFRVQLPPQDNCSYCLVSQTHEAFLAVRNATSSEMDQWVKLFKMILDTFTVSDEVLQYMYRRSLNTCTRFRLGQWEHVLAKDDNMKGDQEEDSSTLSELTLEDSTDDEEEDVDFQWEGEEVEGGDASVARNQPSGRDTAVANTDNMQGAQGIAAVPGELDAASVNTNDGQEAQYIAGVMEHGGVQVVGALMASYAQRMQAIAEAIRRQREQVDNQGEEQGAGSLPSVSPGARVGSASLSSTQRSEAASEAETRVAGSLASYSLGERTPVATALSIPMEAFGQGEEQDVGSLTNFSPGAQADAAPNSPQYTQAVSPGGVQGVGSLTGFLGAQVGSTTNSPTQGSTQATVEGDGSLASSSLGAQVGSTPNSPTPASTQAEAEGVGSPVNSSPGAQAEATPSNPAQASNEGEVENADTTASQTFGAQEASASSNAPQEDNQGGTQGAVSLVSHSLGPPAAAAANTPPITQAVIDANFRLLAILSQHHGCTGQGFTSSNFSAQMSASVLRERRQRPGSARSDDGHTRIRLTWINEIQKLIPELEQNDLAVGLLQLPSPQRLRDLLRDVQFRGEFTYQ